MNSITAGLTFLKTETRALKENEWNLIAVILDSEFKKNTFIVNDVQGYGEIEVMTAIPLNKL